MLGEAKFPELRVEEELQAESGLGLAGVSRVILKTVGEHQRHVCDELACRLIFTIVDFLSDCVQGDRFLDDVIVVGDLCFGHQFHKWPAVLVPDQFNNQLFAG